MSKTSAIWKVSSEDFEKIIKESDSIMDVVRKFGLKHKGNSKTVNNRIKEEGMDISHMNRKNKKRKNKYTQTPNEEIFVENSTYSRHWLINKIIKENLLEYKCVDCGNTGTWNGKKLVLQLDHKNGIGDDNRISNLNFRCPSCHAQTDTYTGKNKGKSIVPKEIKTENNKNVKKENQSIRNFNKNNIIWKVELDKLQKVINESNNYKEVLDRLNINPTKCNCVHLGNRIKEDNIDITKFKENQKLIRIKKLEPLINKNKLNKLPLEKILVENSKYNSHRLKKRLVEEGYMEYKCVDCGNTGIWNEKPLVLQLDHIDGNHENNIFSNLSIKCSNCHSQTDTFCRSNKDKPLHPNYKPKSQKQTIISEQIEEKVYIKPEETIIIKPKGKRIAPKPDKCKDCGKAVTKNKSMKCVNCQHIDVRKVDRPDYDTLIKEIKDKGYLAVGRDYGVSDNAIRKWVKNYEKTLKDLTH